MATRIPKSAKPPEHDNPAGVQQLLAAIGDPLKPVVEAIRTTILGADNQITEGIHRFGNLSGVPIGAFPKQAQAIYRRIQMCGTTRPRIA